MTYELRKEVALLIREMRDELDAAADISKIHIRDVDGGDEAYSITQRYNLGGKKFTRRFAGYLDHPPVCLQVFRKRRFPLWHYKHNHQEVKLPQSWSTCAFKKPCEERLGWRLVQGVLHFEQPIEVVIVSLRLSETFAMRVLCNELRTIMNITRRIQ